MSDEIPFKAFHGPVKQIETNFKFPAMRVLYETCFSAFNKLDAQYADLKAQGINNILTASGAEFNFGYRPRRFSGGPGLPSGRYFSVCDSARFHHNETFHDNGTLRDEITAYYSSQSGIVPAIFDPHLEPDILDVLRSQGVSEDDLKYPLYLIDFSLERETDDNIAVRSGDINLKKGDRSAFTYGIRQYLLKLEKVIDLRYPDTQDWFFRTFVALELENEAAAAEETKLHFLGKKPLTSFAELLKVLVGLEVGGGKVLTQAIGHWLRAHGADGLVFPSARSNAHVQVQDGRPIQYSGWNLVVYQGATDVVQTRLFGRMSTWKD